jgi:Peptidase M50B-like
LTAWPGGLQIRKRMRGAPDADETVFSEVYHLAARKYALLCHSGAGGLIGDSRDDRRSHDASAEDTVLSGIGEIQTPLPAPEALLIGLLATIVVNGPTAWKIVRGAETLVHESAHALVGIMTGRRIVSVTIDRKKGGGETQMLPDVGGVAAFVGYIGPSVAGLIAAALISIGRMVAVLWLGLLLLAVMLLLVRNSFSGVVVLTCGALLYLIVGYTTAGVQTAAAYGVSWFLLLSGTKVVFGAAGKPKDVKDAEILAGKTFLWPAAWCLLWVAGAIAALVVGGGILTHAWGGLRMRLEHANLVGHALDFPQDLASVDDAMQSRLVSKRSARSEVSWSQSRSQGPLRWPEEVWSKHRPSALQAGSGVGLVVFTLLMYDQLTGKRFPSHTTVRHNRR